MRVRRENLRSHPQISVNTMPSFKLNRTSRTKLTPLSYCGTEQLWFLPKFLAKQTEAAMIVSITVISRVDSCWKACWTEQFEVLKKQPKTPRKKMPTHMIHAVRSTAQTQKLHEAKGREMDIGSPLLYWHRVPRDELAEDLLLILRILVQGLQVNDP